MLPWKYHVVLENWRWCWKVKKVVLCHSKMGRGEHCSRYMFSNLPKTITLVRRICFFFQPSPRNKRWARIFANKNCVWYQYQVIFHTILSSLVTVTFPYQEMTIKKCPWETYMAKVASLTMLCAIKTHTRDRNCLLWHFWQYQLFYDGWSFNSTASFLWVK